MSDVDSKNYDELVLPASVVSKLDIARLVAEVEQLDSDMVSAEARAKAGVVTEAHPILSDQLTDFLAANQLGFEDSGQRNQLLSLLRQLKDKAPVIHMTFAANADQETLGKIADWLRQSVHPQSLIVVGLQPGLIGGAYIRTPNHVHDLSVRAQLAGSRHLLVEAVEAVNGGR